MSEETRLTTLTVRDLLDAGLHFGHQTKRWNPKMKRYIFDRRNGIHIIDITQSIDLLEDALRFVKDTVLSGKKILFVGTKKQAQEVVKQAAEDSSMHYVTTRWLGGILTNAATIRKSVRRMSTLDAMKRNNNGVFYSVHKKEDSTLRREHEKLLRNLSGIKDMVEKPGAIFVVDTMREANAVAEARKLGIPVVAIVDSNCDPDPIDYVIPGNDDSLRAIRMITDAVAAVAKSAFGDYSAIAEEKARVEKAKRDAEKAERMKDAKAKSERTRETRKAAAQKDKVVSAGERRSNVKKAGEAMKARAEKAKKAAAEAAAPAVEAPAPAEAAAPAPAAEAPKADEAK